MSRNDEPAFPGIGGDDGHGNYTYRDTGDGRNIATHHNQGMTLRDWFAGQALASGDYDATIGCEIIAMDCYAIADAMLAERSKTA